MQSLRDIGCNGTALTSPDEENRVYVIGCTCGPKGVIPVPED